MSEDAPPFLERPSKTRRKAQSHALQDLGEALAALPEDRLDALDLPERLRDAFAEWHRTRSHEGRRRQMQYIGKLMRGVDEAPLREAVAAQALGSAESTLALHRLETWRAELIASDDAVTRWLAEHPHTEGQRLRQLVRQARAAQAAPEQRQARAFRELFQLLKADDAATDGPDGPEDA